MDKTVSYEKRNDSKDKGKAKKFLTVENMVLISMFAASMAIVSQLSIPMPSGVPVTVQVMGIAMIGTILGWKRGCMAVVVYILVGAVGLPIFSNFRGGLQCLTGTAGGYILAWPVMAVCCGIRIMPEKKVLNLISSIILALIGLMVVEGAGGLQWAMLAGDMTWKDTMAYSVVAFIPKDTVITILGVVLGREIRKILIKAGMTMLE